MLAVKNFVQNPNYIDCFRLVFNILDKKVSLQADLLSWEEELLFWFQLRTKIHLQHQISCNQYKAMKLYQL